MTQASLIDTGKRVVVLFMQGCAEEGCNRTWTVTRARMGQLSEDEWGNTRCNYHSGKRRK